MTATELRQSMAAGGYSVRGLASLLGVAPSTVQRWRTGELPISPLAARAILSL